MFGTLTQLLIANLLFQLLDGVATYHVVLAGVPEANPVVAAAIAQWGLIPGLALCKIAGCFFVLVIFSFRHRLEMAVRQGLTVLASLYSGISIFLLWEMFLLFA